MRSCTKYPLASDALVGISGSIRNTAALLEVVVAMKMPTLSGLDPQMPELLAVFELGFGIVARKLVEENLRRKKRMARNILSRSSIFLL
jgi:hypothetical protein